MENANTITTSDWMPTNLPWKDDFWSRLDAMTVMRLNPHWHIDAEGEAYEVEDILSQTKFKTRPGIAVQGGLYTIEFAGTGMRIAARKNDKGNTDLSYRYEHGVAAGLDPEKAESAMRFWLPSLREYYRLFTSDSTRNRFWRLFMNKVMLKMNPTQRRICSFMFKLTLLEMLLIVILGVGFWFYANAG
ncbi:hypothetical protein [Pseudodesulfovibrio senegalensis]|jgi:hypothetical protein|uniref:Uncharacterized protein n=1 Tax=Pseudodesulfovibrio senegalensis TaxID=1721087 RepID=A0A6N6N4R3_9BACT|nr:hypothetical protein [Pseudodesulfovibrio senegalensis]KAB1443054.1 hypothetical protein F8A88_01970 [Pseudodesulfovibrio senegalensis]